MKIHAFLGIAGQVSLEKKEAERQRLSAAAAALADASATHVVVTAGEFKGHKGVLRSVIAGDGGVRVLLADGRDVRLQASEVSASDAAKPQAYDKLDDEHQHVAREHGYVPGVHTPLTAEEVGVVAQHYLRAADADMQALGQQMVRNYEAIQAASQADADFSHLAVYAAVKLRTLGPNQTEVTVGDKVIFFSYNTPVAMDNAGRVSVTNKKWSVTTSRHINKWLADRGAADVQYVPQEQLDGGAAEVQAAAKKPVVKASVELAFLEEDPDTGGTYFRGSDGKLYHQNPQGRMHECSPEGEPMVEVKDFTIKASAEAEDDAPDFASDWRNAEAGDGQAWKVVAEAPVCSACMMAYADAGRAADEDAYLDDDITRIETPKDGVCVDCGKPFTAVTAASAAQRHNRRQDRIMDNAKSIEKGRVARGERPNPNLTKACQACGGAVVDGICKDCGQDLELGKSLHKMLKDFGAFGAKLNVQAGKVEEFEVEDLGIDHDQYFPGRGVSKGFDAVFVGIGEDSHEALDDALEQAAMAGYDIEPDFEADVKKALGAPDRTVTSYVQSMAPGESAVVDEDGTEGLHYYVALQVKGAPDIDAGLKRPRILAAEEPKKVKESTAEMLKRLAEEKKKAAGTAVAEAGEKKAEAKKDDAEAGEKKAEAKKDEAGAKADEGKAKADEGKAKADEGKAKADEGKAEKKEGSAMSFFKKLAEDTAAKAQPAEPAEKPAYPGVLKPTQTAEGPQAEEAWRIRTETPEKVKEGASPKSIMEMEKRHASVDPEKLSKAADLPLPVAQAVGIYIQCAETIELAQAKKEEASKKIDKEHGFEEAVATKSEIAQHLDQFFREETGGVEFGKLGETFLGIVRKAMKMGYQWTDADLKVIVAQAADMKKFQESQEAVLKALQEKAVEEGRVSYTEDRGLVLMPETESRKGEHAEGQPGTKVREKAKEGVRRAEKQATQASLQAGILDTAKAVWDKLKGLFKKMTDSMKKTNETLEKSIGEAKETKASLSPAMAAMRERAIKAAQARK
jgi:hypothetical protein